MGHVEIRRDKEPIRLFKSNFLEFFTHIHPAVVVIIWAPVIAAFLVVAVIEQEAGAALYIPLTFLAGLFIWTFAEYVLHRFVFHFRPRTPGQERVLFLFHGVHHAQPMSKTRLVMPPVVSIPLALFFYGMFYLILVVLLGVPQWLPSLFAGLVTGYLIYDMIHYSTHHVTLRSRVLLYIRRYHMHHHAQTPDMRFGVTSPLWDIVFGTKPA